MVELGRGTRPLMATPDWPIRFQVGARTVFTVPRRLVRVPLTLADTIGGRPFALPPIASDADGWLVTSLPADLLPTVPTARGIAFVRQRYTRYHTDLTTGHDPWFAGLSGNARSGLRRKAKKLADANGGVLDIRRYRTPAELAAFHPLARQVAAATYQERLLGGGLPDTAAFRDGMQAKAARGEAWGWLLFLDGRPVAYLYCPMTDGDVRYDYVGHDPSVGDLSPGAVLHWHAMRDLFADPDARRFDFTEGEGQHKRQFASAGTPCVDLLLLRRTPANRAVIAGLRLFDAAIGHAKRARDLPLIGAFADRIRRG